MLVKNKNLLVTFETIFLNVQNKSLSLFVVHFRYLGCSPGAACEVVHQKARLSDPTTKYFLVYNPFISIA